MSENTTTKLLTTYSLWSTFRNCRRAAYWRYVKNLAPRDIAAPLTFGKLIHSCLELWHGGKPLDVVLTVIDRALPLHPYGSPVHATWHLARAMVRGYVARYPQETWQVHSLEHQFDGEIINPATGAKSRTFYLGGRVDGVVLQDFERLEGPGGAETAWILEHKTAATIDADYLGKLWTDFQTALYALYVERTLGLQITGVIYNVLAKTRLQQRHGETEAEYQDRYAAACAKNKSGKSTATRELPESDADFAARLDAWYAAPERFHRETLILSRDQLRLIEEEVWELTQAWLDCRRRDTFYMNPDNCFRPGRTCPYFPICSSNSNPNVIANLYDEKAPHEELREHVAGLGGTAGAASGVDPDWSPGSLSF